MAIRHKDCLIGSVGLRIHRTRGRIFSPEIRDNYKKKIIDCDVCAKKVPQSHSPEIACFFCIFRPTKVPQKVDGLIRRRTYDGKAV
jgi:hypothetical protein